VETVDFLGLFLAGRAEVEKTAAADDDDWASMWDKQEEEEEEEDADEEEERGKVAEVGALQHPPVLPTEWAGTVPIIICWAQLSAAAGLLGGFLLKS
jgi:hypothetical protein